MKKIDFFDLSKLGKYKLIQGVIIKPLKVNQDSRGILVETLKTTWEEIYSKKMPFSQSYFSVTKSNVARDEDQWHLHPKKQIDRFVVVKGKIVLALYDWRKNSKTKGLLNLFLMGELRQNKGYYTLLIPKNVLHCFLVVSKKEAVIINFPSHLYDSKEEGRVKFNQVKLENGNFFSWDKIRKKFRL